MNSSSTRGGEVGNGLLQELEATSLKACLYEAQRDAPMHKVAKATRRPRKPLLRFPRTAVRILEQWLLDHRDAPYATQHEQDELKIQTGLKRSQIMNWFANARKRGKIQTLQLSSSTSHKAPTPAPVPLFPQIANLHPFERWLHLGMEHEAASSSAIKEALLKCNPNQLTRAMATGHEIAPSHLCGTSTNWQYFRQCGSSVSSLEIRSYAANAKSVSSDEWRHPEGLTKSLTKSARRHRRLDTHHDGTMGGLDTRETPRKFQCSFCNDCFKKKHDWQRHEKSQHLPLEKWICCPQGSVNVDPATNEVTCAFCGMLEPDPEHIQNHGYTQCISRSSAERTFYRKDHLRQHLRLMHNDCPMMPSMEAWKSAVNMIRSRCGFCKVEMDTWGARVEHLAEHFRNGARMADWDGDWGFESEISEILERATLPATRKRAKKKTSEALPLGRAEGGCKIYNEVEDYHLNNPESHELPALPDASQDILDYFEYSSIQCSSIFDSLENPSSLDEFFYETGELEFAGAQIQAQPIGNNPSSESQQIQQCILNSKLQSVSDETHGSFDMNPNAEFGFIALPTYTSMALEADAEYPILFDRCTEDSMQEPLLYQFQDICFLEQ